MRFIHTADLHLGMKPDKDKPWGTARADAVRRSLARFVDLCNEEKTDLLLIAGDLFHRPPSAAELKEADSLFLQLKKTRVLLIAGNHDYIRPGSPWTGFHFSPNVYLFASPEPETLDFPEWGLSVTGFSYDRAVWPDPLLDTLPAPRDGRHHLLLAHGGDAAHLPFRAASLSAQGWDYAAFGHIHTPGLSRDSRIAMPGSPEPLDRSETGRHGYFAGTLDDNGLKVEWRPFSQFSYTELNIKVTPELTQAGLEKALKRRFAAGEAEAAALILKGYRDPDIVFDTEALLRDFPLSEVRDETRPDFPWEEWAARPDHDLLKRCIDTLKDPEGSTDRSPEELELRRKALYYGIDALLSTERSTGSEVLR